MTYSREDFEKFAQEEMLTPPSTFPWDTVTTLAVPTLAVGAGFLRTSTNKRLWDHYFSGLRHLEGTMPLGILETFHGSEAISPLSAPDHIDLRAKEHSDLFRNNNFKDYLSRTTGKSVAELEKSGAFKKGLFWKKTGDSLGTLRVRGGPVLSTNIAAVSTGARRSGFLIEWLGHSMGVKNPTFLKQIKESSSYLRPEWLFAGAGSDTGSRAKLAGKYGYGLFSATIARMNLLLKSPFDLEVVQEFAKKVPFIKSLNLGVKSGPAHKMIPRYAVKGAAIFGAYKWLDFQDYLGREYGQAATVPLGAATGAITGLAIGLRRGKLGPRYGAYGAIAGGILGLTGEGPLSSLAGLYASTRVAQASISQAIGLGSGARRTEDFFPGLTSPATLIGAAASGLLLGGAYDWSERVKLSTRAAGAHAKLKGLGKPIPGLYEQVDNAIEARKENLYNFHKNRAAQQKGLAAGISDLKAAYYGSEVKGKFKGKGAGRFAAIGIAAYEGLNIAGSLVAGDVVGAGFQAGLTAAAGYAYAKKGGALGLGILLLGSLLREKAEPDQLERIYSGEEKVAIRSGRWWEAGRSEYTGKRPYYRPHRVALMRSGGDKAALYGSEENYWETDPFLNPVEFLKNPYKREELMWEQGYKFPVSHTPFIDIPVVGPTLSATLGRILKPPRLMGQEEWLPEQQQMGPGGLAERPAEEPIQRTSLKGVIGEQFYRLTELVGLPGFATQSLAERVLGTQTLFENDQLATPSIVSGAESSFWSLELGGLGMLCIPKGSTVQSEEGLKVIEDIVVGDKVLSRDQKFHTVRATSSRQDNTIVTVKVQTIGMELKATPNHVIPVWEFYPCHGRNSKGCIINYRGNSCKTCSRRTEKITTIDKPIVEVQIGDWLEVPLPRHSILDNEVDLTKAEKYKIYTDKYIYNFGTQYFSEALEFIENSEGCISRRELRDLGIPDQYAKEALHSYRNHCTPRRFRRYIKINEEISYLLGWYAAEGNLISNGVQFTLNISEVKFAKKLQRIAQRNFGATSSIYFYPEKNTLVLHIRSSVLNCLSEILIGSGSHEKSVDPRIMFNSESIRAAFLRGYMLGDGFCNKDKHAAGISTCSKDLANQSFLIGLSLGFRGLNILDYLEKPNGKYPQGTKRKETLRHYVSWSCSTVNYLKSFLTGKIDSLPIHGNNKGSFVYEGKLYVQVKEVNINHEECTVYDLEIEDLHYFTSNYFSVHNSEGIRRYIPRRRTQVDYKNPLGTDLPSWLPGPDSDYFLDFSRADIFSQIKEPWHRLPGKGLETLNPELKGVDPENYSNFWKFKVLADVAPWSKEYSNIEKQISQDAANDRLTVEQLLEIQNIKKEVADMKKVKNFSPYNYGEGVEKRRVRITQELEPGVYLTDTFGKAPISLKDVDMSPLALGARAYRDNASYRPEEALLAGINREEQARRVLRNYVQPGQEVDVFVQSDPDSMIERSDQGYPIIPVVMHASGMNVNRALIEQGLADTTGDRQTLDANMATGSLQRAFGRLWENISHGAETPLESFTPLGPVSKFISKRTALEDYQRSQVYARDIALWEKPVSHFLAPGLSTTAWWAGWRGIPQSVQQRYMVEEYFDRLEYEKYSRLQRVAEAENRGKEAARYQTLAGRTRTGADYFAGGQASGLKSTLSDNERQYFESFVEAPTAAERREISRVVSPQFRQILESQWARRAAESASLRQEAGISIQGDQARMQQFDSMRNQQGMSERIIQIAEEQRATPMPGPNWLGWCIPSNQEILTRNFVPQNASLIQEGDVLSLGSEVNKVCKIYQRYINEEIVILSTEDDSFHQLKATKDHLVYVLKKGESFPEFIPMSTVKKGDYLAVRKFNLLRQDKIFDLAAISKNPRLKFDQDEVWVYYLNKKQSRARPLKRFLRITPDIAWLLGYFLAEGHLCYRNGLPRSIVLTQSIEEGILLNKVRDICQSIGIQITTYERRRKSGNSRGIHINSPILAELFQILVPGNCATKYLTDIQCLSSKEHIYQFLLGIFSGDASKTEQTRSVLTTCSYTLAIQIKQLVYSLGYPSFFSKVITKDRKPKYRISVYCRDISYQFINDILNINGNYARIPKNSGLKKRTNDRWLESPLFIFTRIKTVGTQVYTGNVYDFSMMDLMEYSTPVGILHNSPNSEIEDYKVKTILDNNLDAPSYGVWRSDERRIRRRPWVQHVSFDGGDRTRPSSTAMHRRLNESLGMSGHRQFQIHPRASSRNSMNINVSGHDRVSRYLRDPSIMQF